MGEGKNWEETLGAGVGGGTGTGVGGSVKDMCVGVRGPGTGGVAGGRHGRGRGGQAWDR